MSVPHDLPILIDARAVVDGRPVALYEVLKKPWLAFYLDAAKEARALDRVTVVVRSEHLADVCGALAKHFAGDTIQTVAAIPDSSPLLVLHIDRVYLRHRLVKLLKRGTGTPGKLVIYEISRASDLAAGGSFVFRDMWLPLARPFNMPLARELALWLRNTRITPNQVTLAGGALRVAGAVLAGFGSWPLNVVAAFMVEAAWTLDLTDGYLARLTRRTSAIGHWLDTFMDEVGTVAILAALAVGSMRATGQQVWLYVGLGALMASYLTSFGFWYDGLNAPIESAETVTGRNGSPPGKLSALPRRGLSALLSLHRSIDARPHVLAAGLLFNVPYVLVGFFAIAGGVSLIRYFQLQLRGRGP